jgi:hypothetical protein
VKTLTKKIFEKLFADRRYISKNLFDMLFNNSIQLVTGIKNNMKNRLMPLMDRILLRKPIYTMPGVILRNTEMAVSHKSLAHGQVPMSSS